MKKKIVPYAAVLALGLAAVITAMYAGKDCEPFPAAERLNGMFVILP